MNFFKRKVRLPKVQNQVARHTRLMWRLHDDELFGHQKRNGGRLSFLNNPAAPGIPYSTLHPARCCRSLTPLKRAWNKVRNEQNDWSRAIVTGRLLRRGRAIIRFPTAGHANDGRAAASGMHPGAVHTALLRLYDTEPYHVSRR